MKTLIGIPLYNEQAYLKECIDSLFSLIENKCLSGDCLVLIADDGSTDNSTRIYLDLEKRYHLKHIRHENGPLGYGATIQSLFKYAKEKDFDTLITFDADLQHSPFSVVEVSNWMQEHKSTDVVSTSRFLSYKFWNQNTKMPLDRYLLNMFITKEINRSLKIPMITDAFCGLKGYRCKTSIPEEEMDKTYSFPLEYWKFISDQNLVLKEIETPIIYRVDRRGRGGWQERIQAYFTALENVFSDRILISKIEQKYEQAIAIAEELLTEFPKFPILPYPNFLSLLEWVEKKTSDTRE